TFRSKLALIAPIRFGTGINTKNLQALAHGLPVVTTSIGAEGLQLIDNQHALIADSPNEFAANVVKICSNSELWELLSTNGQSLIAANFAPTHLCKRLREILLRISALVP